MIQPLHGKEGAFSPPASAAPVSAVPGLPRHRRSDKVAVAAAAILCALIAAIPFLLYHRAYYHDDMQSQYMPALVAIGKALAAGVWPSLTLQVNYGGALAGEYQYGLYNPIELLKMMSVAQFGDLESGAAFLAVTDYAVLGAGVYLLARRFGASSGYALLAAAAFACNNFVFYWFASSWRPGLSSLGYLALACACLMTAHKSRGAFLAAVATAYLTLTAGWPQAIMVLGLFALFQLGMAWNGNIRRRRIAIPFAALVSAGLLALPALMPLLAMGAHASRQGGVFNEGLLQPDLYSLLAVSSPFHFGHILGFSGFDTLSVPMYLAAWFALPFLPFIDFAKARRLVAPKPLLLGAILLLILTQGPQQFSALRWPFRFIPYYHLIVIVLFSVLMSRAPARVTQHKRSLALAIVVFQTFVAAQSQPAFANLALVAAAIAVIGVVVGLALYTRRETYLPLWLGAVTVGLFVLTHLLFPINRQMPDWRAAASVGRVSDLASIPESYSAAIGPPSDDRPVSESRPFGNMALVRGGAEYFGYSPIGENNFVRSFGNQTHGPANGFMTAAMLAPTEYGGLRFVDLAKIDTAVLLSPAPGAAPRFASGGFACAVEAPRVTTCRRTSRSAYPGSLAFASSGLTISPLADGTATSERFSIDGRGGNAKVLVFNRLAWPGYRLTLNGASIPLERDRFGLLVARLPDEAAVGELHLIYRPPGFMLGIGSALVGLLLALGLALSHQFWSPRPAPDSQARGNGPDGPRRTAGKGQS